MTVLAKPLTPEEAIGKPGRRDFPILEGKERVIEATVLGARGQAFTDSASDFEGRLEQPLWVTVGGQDCEDPTWVRDDIINCDMPRKACL